MISVDALSAASASPKIPIDLLGTRDFTLERQLREYGGNQSMQWTLTFQNLLEKRILRKTCGFC
ncbi:MAG TPA: hypothetical protein PKY35_03830 [Candidatus Hydrogenedentes bacterium]|nr:hypothetical protein [Candidatus Hydrogenedentota bacterium]HPO84748.1 hypothetical protein [Candidatus Hydrogenedentota bacterium]